MTDLTSARVATALDTLALLLTIGLGVEILWGGGNPVRLLLAVVFTTVVPGWALLAFKGPRDLVSRLAVSVGLSLALCSLGATVMVWTSAWHPLILFSVIGGGSGVCLAVALTVRSPRGAALVNRLRLAAFPIWQWVWDDV